MCRIIRKMRKHRATVAISVHELRLVCCSMLQCVAVFMSRIMWKMQKHHAPLQFPCTNSDKCVAVCCSVLQFVAMCCSVFHCVAVCRSVLQCVAVFMRRIMLKHHATVTIFPARTQIIVLQCVAVCFSVLYCVALSCIVLQCVQCVALCCSVHASNTSENAKTTRYRHNFPA